MPALKKAEIELPTGKLELVTDGNVDLDAYCGFAARANPKRGFLIVSKVLGRHLPASPTEMRGTMDAIAKKVPGDLIGPAVFLGMAETATALGQGVFAAYQKANPLKDVIYLQSSRQIIEGAELISCFEEGHSHATTHLIQVGDRAMQDIVRAAPTLVIVDDECSTGRTYVAVAKAMLEAMPNLECVVTCCITDWSGGHYIDDMPRQTLPVSLISGSMTWTAGEAPASVVLTSGSNVAGRAPKNGMKSRSGLTEPEQATRPEIEVKFSERILILGEGEHSYEALLVAEEVERKGGVAAVQCITRSPALLGWAMETKSCFSDSYGSGAPCFLYNVLKHQPDRIVIVAEQLVSQAEEARSALQELGSPIPVDIVLCSYAKGE